MSKVWFSMAKLRFEKKQKIRTKKTWVQTNCGPVFCSQDVFFGLAVHQPAQEAGEAVCIGNLLLVHAIHSEVTIDCNS